MAGFEFPLFILLTAKLAAIPPLLVSDPTQADGEILHHLFSPHPSMLIAKPKLHVPMLCGNDTATTS